MIEVLLENEDIKLYLTKNTPDRDGDIYWIYFLVNKQTKEVMTTAVHKE